MDLPAGAWVSPILPLLFSLPLAAQRVMFTQNNKAKVARFHPTKAIVLALRKVVTRSLALAR